MDEITNNEKAVLLNLLQKELRVQDIRSSKYAQIKNLMNKIQTDFKGEK